MISIIVTSYDQTQTLRHTTMVCLANIIRYTPSDSYELIVVDSVPKYPLRDDYEVLGSYKLIVNEKDKGYYEAMNQGAKAANGDYLCFIENDVFVHEGWFEGLSYYLDNNLADGIMPSQIPATREWMENSYKMSYEDALGKGISEQGLLLIKKDAFLKAGKWDRRFKGIYGWKAFYIKAENAGVSISNTAKVMVTHITGATYYHNMEFDQEKSQEQHKKERGLIDGYT